ncbi:MAG: hypothetical protein ABR575_11865 [Actinomycetota bacterium]
MSVLLIGLDWELGEIVVERLLGQGDEVRVLEDDPTRAAMWRTHGAHVATGHADDADLIERAAQGVRTIVLGGTLPVAHEVALAAIQDAATTGRLDVRVVVHAGGRRDGTAAARSLGEAGLEHVVVMERGRRALGRRSPTRAKVAEALDAADDLAGAPRMVLDLTEAEAWRALGLDPP